MTGPGVRVVAIRDGVGTTINIFGFGTYVGDEVPPPGTPGPFGDHSKLGINNPKIELDTGGVVWGCQCWWFPCQDEAGLRRRFPDAEDVARVPLPPLLEEVADDD